MEFLQLQYFRNAAHTENFSHTAEQFVVPPSSVSTSIKKLETELGVQLFDRSANKLSLNEKGRLFLKCVDNIFFNLDKTKKDLQSFSNKPSGKIRMIVNTNRRMVTTAIFEFRIKYPDISFILELDENKNYKNYDVIITDSYVDNSFFNCDDLLTEEIKLAVPPSNPLSAKKQIDMSLLKNENFICNSPNHSLRNITNILCRQAGFVPNIVIECNDPFYIREYLKMELGISIVPVFSWKNQFDSSISLLKINDGVYRHTKLYVNKNASPVVKIFSEYVKKFITKRNIQ